MNFNKHSALEGQHAVLSASNSSWVNYDAEKMQDYIRNRAATRRGTELHNLAADLIRLGVKLPRTTQTLNAYVNDAIGFRMQPEQMLFYSPNAFGTADAISFDQSKGLLRIHDLKTGVSPTPFRQLHVYVAFFCLEYDIKPGEIQAKLRIYKQDEVFEDEPELMDIVNIMDKIKKFDQVITQTYQELR